jgi:hypothetical protein
MMWIVVLVGCFGGLTVEPSVSDVDAPCDNIIVINESVANQDECFAIDCRWVPVPGEPGEVDGDCMCDN